VHKGIRGVIKDTNTKVPINEATIHIKGNDKNVTSYSSGDYWKIVTPGKYIVSISHPDYISESCEVIVHEGAATVADFNLELKGPNYKELQYIIDEKLIGEKTIKISAMLDSIDIASF